MYRYYALGHQEFTPEQQGVISALMTKIQDRLLAQKGLLVTPVHYKSKIHVSKNALENLERYGLLKTRTHPTHPRLEVMVSKTDMGQAGTYTVCYEVDLGRLTDEEKPAPEAAFEVRRSLHPTGRKSYADDADALAAITHDTCAYLLDGLLPWDAQRT